MMGLEGLENHRDGLTDECRESLTVKHRDGEDEYSEQFQAQEREAA